MLRGVAEAVRPRRLWCASGLGVNPRADGRGASERDDVGIPKEGAAARARRIRPGRRAAGPPSRVPTRASVKMCPYPGWPSQNATGLHHKASRGFYECVNGTRWADAAYAAAVDRWWGTMRLASESSRGPGTRDWPPVRFRLLRAAGRPVPQRLRALVRLRRDDVRTPGPRRAGHALVHAARRRRRRPATT